MKWIDVNDRLPEENKFVLACCVGFFGIQVVQLFDDTLPGKKKKMIWKSKLTSYKRIKVSHWMPLPEPPKMK